MLKIPDNKKFRNLPDYMKEHLSMLPPDSTRATVSMFCFILLDMCVLPLLYPRINLIHIITIPLLLFIHLWAIRLLIKDPRSTRVETTLFLSVFSIISAICYFITSLKVSYVFIGITNVWYYITLTGIDLIIIVILIQYQIEKYSKLDYKRDESEKWYNSGRWIPLVISAPGVGYIIFQTTKDSETAMHSLFLCVTIVFTLILAYMSAKFTHQYFFIKLNRRLVDINTPTKRQIK
ncbi:hypothetical protein [Bacillus sp. RAR_GA_16]|uniref:hypothetical protein n=1 Tax=Bacillus sp. RAR_GA_16 TaxID=2876774 RepID=UPI001CCA1960|nr:hypothetical protein [Bacillus sp. RAR_GA_16]MCA0172646.1 hypothetical protein [Bacillus sp. RAR_GA_16]